MRSPQEAAPAAHGALFPEKRTKSFQHGLVERRLKKKQRCKYNSQCPATLIKVLELFAAGYTTIRGMAPANFRNIGNRLADEIRVARV